MVLLKRYSVMLALMLVAICSSRSVEAVMINGKDCVKCGEAVSGLPDNEGLSVMSKLAANPNFSQLMAIYCVNIASNNEYGSVKPIVDEMRGNGSLTSLSYNGCTLERGGGQGTFLQLLIEYPSDQIRTLSYIKSQVTDDVWVRAINSGNGKTLIGHLEYMIKTKFDDSEKSIARNLIVFLRQNGGK